MKTSKIAAIAALVALPLTGQAQLLWEATFTSSASGSAVLEMDVDITFTSDGTLADLQAFGVGYTVAILTLEDIVIAGKDAHIPPLKFGPFQHLVPGMAPTAPFDNGSVRWTGAQGGDIPLGTSVFFGAGTVPGEQVQFGNSTELTGGEYIQSAAPSPFIVLARSDTVTITLLTPIPEPHEYALLAGLSLGLFAVYRRFRKAA